MLRSEKQMQSLGMETLNGLSAVKGLPNVPPKAIYALLQAHGNAVRWRDDGTDPTAAIGHLIPADKKYRYISELLKIRFTEASASATLTVTYYV